MRRPRVLPLILGIATALGLLPARGAEAQAHPRPVNNAYELLGETPMVRIHIGGRNHFDTTTPCGGSYTAVALVFKVADTDDVPSGFPYWMLLEREVLPVVRGTCPNQWEFKIDNYVAGYRLFPADGNDRKAKRVFAANEPVPERAGFEAPIHHAEVRWNGASNGFERQRMLRSDVWPDREDGASIAALRAFAGEKTASEAAATVSAADIGYTHGVGFAVPDEMKAAEANAYAVLNTGGGTGSGRDAEAVMLLATRRKGIESALAVLSDWTRDRLVPSPDFKQMGFDNADLFHDVMEGEFKSWLGAEPSTPNGLHDRGRGMYLDRVLNAYHYAYGQACRTDESLPWLPYRYRVDLIRRDRLGFERTVREGESIERPLRRPFHDALVERIMGTRGGMGDVMAGLSSLMRGGGLGPSFDDIVGESTTFLRRNQCGSDVVRQFEVNLYLLAEGYPPLQVLLPEASLMLRRQDQLLLQ